MFVVRVRSEALSRIVELVPQFDIETLGEIASNGESVTDLLITPRAGCTDIIEPIHVLTGEYDVRNMWPA